VGWHDENGTDGFYKLMKNAGGAVGWHLAQDAGTYLFKDGASVGWRAKNLGVQLGTKALGSLIKVKINGVDQNFIVVQHGKPDASYDNSFNGGTVLVANKAQTDLAWGTTFVTGSWTYWGSDLNSYMVATFGDLIEATVKNKIQNVIIREGYGLTDGTVGTQSMSAVNVFAPASKEMGYADSGAIGGHAVPNDGNAFAYYAQGNAKPSGIWWTRTPVSVGTGRNSLYSSHGTIGYAKVDTAHGALPAFVLPQTTLIDANGYVMA
jgi:hypothetical protein